MMASSKACEELWVLWNDLPRIGKENAQHLAGMVEIESKLSEPVYVQEVYIMDGFMRALCEFRSAQTEYQVSIPIPCVANEPLEKLKQRLFERARKNFIALQEMSMEEKIKLYGPSGEIRHYKWIQKFFGSSWKESDLKWYVYQEYDLFLDPSMWAFYGPDLAQPEEIYDEIKLFRAKDAIAKHKFRTGSNNTKVGTAKPTSTNAIYLLPTHIRLILWRQGYDKLMYTLPRNITFEALKTLVEADLGQPGCFSKFDCGSPGNLFGPGKQLSDVISPSTVGVSHSWS